MNRDHFPMWVY